MSRKLRIIIILEPANGKFLNIFKSASFGDQLLNEDIPHFKGKRYIEFAVEIMTGREWVLRKFPTLTYKLNTHTRTQYVKQL